MAAAGGRLDAAKGQLLAEVLVAAAELRRRCGHLPEAEAYLEEASEHLRVVADTHGFKEVVRFSPKVRLSRVSRGARGGL